MKIRYSHVAIPIKDIKLNTIYTTKQSDNLYILNGIEDYKFTREDIEVLFEIIEDDVIDKVKKVKIIEIKEEII